LRIDAVLRMEDMPFIGTGMGRRILFLCASDVVGENRRTQEHEWQGRNEDVGERSNLCARKRELPMTSKTYILRYVMRESPLACVPHRELPRIE
jgi:hypothetical protein